MQVMAPRTVVAPVWSMSLTAFHNALTNVVVFVSKKVWDLIVSCDVWRQKILTNQMKEICWSTNEMNAKLSYTALRSDFCYS